MWGKEAERLETSFDLAAVAEAWKEGVRRAGSGKKGQGKAKGKGKGGEVDVRLSDDVGDYVCGFLYYGSLLEMGKRKARRDVVFLHVPPLEGEEEIEKGRTVVVELIKALVHVDRLAN